MEKSTADQHGRQTESSSSLSVMGPVIIAMAFGGALLLLILALFRRKNTPADALAAGAAQGKVTALNGSQAEPKNHAAAGKEANRRAQASQNVKGKIRDTYEHALLVTTLRGHTGDVCDADFSANSKYLVTSDEDRSVHIWTCADFLTDNPAKEIRHNRLNLDFDHAALIRFSPDSKALLGRMDQENIVRVLKLNKKADGSFSSLQKALDLPASSHGEILFMDINCNGKFIMTGYSSTNICLWSLKGQLLSTLATNVATMHSSKVSPCGRFIAASGFTSEVKVWEANFDKITGEFHSVERAFELKGHSAAVPDFAFSGDSTHMVSVSKDKTFRLYDINVDYKKKQDARLVCAAAWTKLDMDTANVQVALSNDSRCIVIASRMDILILSGVDGSRKTIIQSPLSVPIKKLMLDPSSGFIVVIGGRNVRIFRNAMGYEIVVDTLKDKLKYVTQDSVRQRLEHQLQEAEKVLLACKIKFSTT